MRYRSRRSLISSAILHLMGIAVLLLFKIAYRPRPPAISIESGLVRAPSTEVIVPSLDSPPSLTPPEAYLDVPQAEVEFAPSVDFRPADAGQPLTAYGSGAAGLSASQQRFAQVVSGFAENGLDLVIVFDSTSSMREEIDDLKANLTEITETLFTKLPKTRISIVFYRDFGDSISVDGLPLSNRLRDIARYLRKIEATGGGQDLPEAVRLGLQTAIENNAFRPEAHKVMLLFGDAAPHDSRKCRYWTSHFRRSLGGRVSTITCGQPLPLEPFVKLAKAGGGESIVLHRNQRIVSELSLLLFGKENRIEASRFLADKR